MNLSGFGPTTKVRALVTVGALSLTAGGVLAGSALAGPPPRSDKQIPNLTTVKDKIIAYHDSGNWNRQQWRVDGRARRYIAKRVAAGVRKPAITLDVDDTALETYSYEVDHDFGYDAKTSDAYTYAEKFGAIPATRAVARYAHSHGVKVFFITGRRQSDKMRAATVGNLTKRGFPEPDGLFLRPNGDKNSSVVPFKSGTRAKLQREGYHIIGNLGDQRSDLRGGHCERSYKLPNPMYSLP